RLAFVSDLLQRVADEKPIDLDTALPKSSEGIADRNRMGRVLYQCLERLQNFDESQRNQLLLSRCSSQAQELRTSREAPGAVESGALQPLSSAEVVSLARWLGVFLGVGRSSAQRLGAIPTIRQSEVPERERQQYLTEAVRLGAISIEYIAGELPRLARSQLPDAKLREFRNGLLEAMLLGEQLSVGTDRLANALLVEYLNRVGR